MFLHITEAKPLDNYRVEVTFNDGKRGIADLSSVLHDGVFEALRDPVEFSRLTIDPELETIAWPNGVDIAPEFIYFQAFKDDPDMEHQFKAWGYVN